MTKVYVQTYGCSANFSDSEIMKGLLAKEGVKIAENSNEADVIVLNICTVKGEKAPLKEIISAKKKLVVAGCITKNMVQKIKAAKPDAALLSTHNLDSIHDAVSGVMRGRPSEFMTQQKIDKTNLPVIRGNPVIGITQILSGCAHFCTYCSTKLVKTKLVSYTVEKILDEVRANIAAGCREIWLTSQDNGAYMVDQAGKTQLHILLKEVCRLRGSFKVRLGMTNPNHILPILDDLIELFSSDKMFKFIHLPVQSGNDEVLKNMRRKYTAEDYKQIIRKLKSGIPDITVSTDVIVGFPGETDRQFEDTYKLIESTRPEVLNISRFQPRPGTAAYGMQNQLHGRVAKERSRLMTIIHHNVAKEQNEKWLGKTMPVLIDEHGKDGTFVGRNSYYKPVIVRGSLRLGDTVDVKITETAIHDLRGELVE